jgi:predicted Zn-dependent peptidase
MISTVNPIKEHLLPRDVDRRPLAPQRYVCRNGKVINYFQDASIGLIKMDFIFEAGTALQDKLLQTASAIHLVTEGTPAHTSRQIAEFMDFRGIIVEKSNDEVSSTLTVYAMPRYVDELLPLLYEMLFESVYPEAEFAVFLAKRRHQLMVNLQRTSYVAGCRCRRSLYGHEHPQGRFAVPSDYDLLTVDDVREFHSRYLTPSRMEIVLGGAVSAAILAAFDRVFGGDVVNVVDRVVLPAPKPETVGVQKVEVAGAIQNTLRVGRLLPMRWDDRKYAEFMILSTALGGYFGSRLMSNIREEKGYTYGISAMTQICRGSLAFYIISDVSAGKAELAQQEIMLELERLRREPMPKEELELVRTCMLGDFMRSVDGVFERSERFCQMLTSGIDERFTDNFLAVLEPDAVTAEGLCVLADSLLNPNDMVFVNAGIV